MIDRHPLHPSRLPGGRLRMSWLLLTLALAVGLWAAPAQAQKKISFAYPSVTDMGDIPSLLAWKLLAEKGYEVTPRVFAKTELAVQAVVRGDTDIGAAASIAVVKAIEQGMDLRIIGEQVKNEWQLMTPASIRDPKQLEGKRVAYHGPFTVTEALVKWMAKHYSIRPQWMIIPGSEVRAEALMRGQIDATPAEIADVVNVLESRPGAFHVLISYARIFPNLHGTVYVARTDVLQKQPEMVEAMLEAVLRMHRQIEENPGVVTEQAPKLLSGQKPSQMAAIAKDYRDLKIWEVNGGLDRARNEESLKFYIDSGLVKKQLKTEQVYATEPLERVLRRIGRR
ncbi:MAG: ABC transporter substrate-binding protein [Deltaproteobacteria bacterium]|nr:ABC transporter substrate-binding protein [Deltaproteobacteria bacterium]MBI3079091.1 ABC transporter substrate-binding protein [Deltaproteobacteria bacterium]